jgi:hypothetical protein
MYSENLTIGSDESVVLAGDGSLIATVTLQIVRQSYCISNSYRQIG